MTGRVVLITGCSSGIGRNLAERLSRVGYTVVATARRPETLVNLPVARRTGLDVGARIVVHRLHRHRYDLDDFRGWHTHHLRERTGYC